MTFLHTTNLVPNVKVPSQLYCGTMVPTTVWCKYFFYLLIRTKKIYKNFKHNNQCIEQDMNNFESTTPKGASSKVTVILAEGCYKEDLKDI